MSLPIKHFQCGNCGQMIEVPRGVPKPANCPRCGALAMMIHRLDKGPPGGRRGRGGASMATLAALASPFFVLGFHSLL